MVVARRGLVRAAAAACVATMLLLTARTTPLDAHPLHTTITEITFDGRHWTAEDSPDGWTTDRKAARDAVAVTTG